MAQGFSDVWRTVRLYVQAPTFLVREWTSAAYKELARARHWTFLQGELRLQITASRAVTVGVTLGSTTVTSAALFVAGDAGRQFRISPFQVYTIQSVTNASAVVLDSAYGDPTAAAASATIYDGYAVLPADFESFRLIADPYNQRRLAFWFSQDQLNVLDPTRQVTDAGPRTLVARPPSTYSVTLGRPTYEYWPAPTTARSYPALYNKQAQALTDVSTFSGVLGDAADVLIEGVLARAAEWPGTPDQKNPYFDLQLARLKRGEFLAGIQRLSLRDDDQSPDDVATVNWARWPLADLAYNDEALRATDATVSDLY